MSDPDDFKFLEDQIVKWPDVAYVAVKSACVLGVLFIVVQCVCRGCVL